MNEQLTQIAKSTAAAGPRPRPPIKVLGILRGDHNIPKLTTDDGQYYNTFKELFHNIDPNLEFKIYTVQQGEFPQELTECDAYIITGSRSSVYDLEQEPWIAQLLKLAQEISRQEIPQVGICFGHQLLATAFGGEVQKNATGWGIGVHSYQTTMKSTQEKLQDEFSLLVSHQDQVTRAPALAAVTASSDFCPIAAMESTSQKFISFQGHPEFTEELALDIIERRQEDFGVERTAQARASLAQPRDHLKVAKYILDFLNEQRQPTKS